MSLMMGSEAFLSFNLNSTSTQPLTCVVMADIRMCVQLGDPNTIIKSYENNEAVNIVRLLIVKVSVSERLAE